MKNYMIVHRYIIDGIAKSDYQIEVESKCKSAKDAILKTINNVLFSDEFVDLYHKAATTLTDVDAIKLYNWLLDDEDEIVAVYEINEEIYFNKNLLNILPLNEEFIGDNYEEDINIEE